MALVDLTRSEELFEAFCKQEALPLRRLPPREGVRTPDYVVGRFWRRIAVEVKQLDPNPEERQQQAAFDAGKIVTFAVTPGGRVRKAIDDGYPQLRAMTHACWPGILLLYDNLHLPTVHLDPYAIKTAMYGLEQVVMAPSVDGSLRSMIIDTIFGPKRKVGPERNRALSAVGHLYRESADRLGVDLYHNIYAAAPLKPSRLQASSVRHYRLATKEPGMSQEWERF
jgi:hypothetical protein